MLTDDNNKKADWNDKRKFKKKRVGITGEINMEAACCDVRWHGHQLDY